MTPLGPALGRLGKPRSLAAALALVAIVVAGAHALNPPRGDDLAYLRWAAERAWDPWTPMFRPPPFPGWRPSTAFVWWLSVSLEGVGGWLPELALCSLWVLALLAAGGWARARWGDSTALWTMAFMLATDRFRELLIWRSWLTSAGSVAFVFLTLWALERRRGAWALVLGALAVGFKETAGPPLIVAALVVYGRPAIALGILAAALPGLAKAVLDADLVAQLHQRDWTLAERAITYAGWIFGTGWIPVMVAATLLGGRSASAVAERRWVWVAASALVAPALYRVANPTYLLDSTVVIAGWTASAVQTGTRGRVAAGALAVSLFTLPGTLLDARWQAKEWFFAREAYAELLRGAPTAWTRDSAASETARWLALRLEFDLGLAEAPDCADTVGGVRVCH